MHLQYQDIVGQIVLMSTVKAAHPYRIRKALAKHEETDDVCHRRCFRRDQRCTASQKYSAVHVKYQSIALKYGRCAIWCYRKH